MILGIGTDICDIRRIEQSIDRYGQRFLDKTFTPEEQSYCQSKARPAMSFAKRFAAKEAILKSLGTGMADGIQWKDMEVLNQERGQPEITLQGNGKAVAESLNLNRIHISITHGRNYAVAHAIAES